MGWQDRKYNRGGGSFSGSSSGNPILQLFFGSIPLGTWFGIRVRMHASLAWLLVFRLWSAGTMDWQNALASSVALFAIIVLHEFGHCVGARMVGGQAEEILLWPLGGLAMTTGTHSAWARFVTVICGPLVNVILGFIAGAWIFQITHVIPPINPLLPFLGRSLSGGGFPWYLLLEHPWGYYLWWAYATNVSLLLFNLLPIFPFDGGQLLQSILWKIVGYHKSMYIACVIGMIGSAMLCVLGLTQTGGMMLVFLGIMGLVTCYQQIQILKETGAQGYGEEDQYSAYHEEKPRRRKRGWFSTRWAKAAARRARRDRKDQEQIDAILAKVHDKGLHSLSWWEKRALRKATERQRQEDLAERL